MKPALTAPPRGAARTASGADSQPGPRCRFLSHAVFGFLVVDATTYCRSRRSFGVSEPLWRKIRAPRHPRLVPGADHRLLVRRGPLGRVGGVLGEILLRLQRRHAA